MAENDCRMWVRNSDWLGVAIDDSIVMLDVDSGSYFGLNRTAGLIWEALAVPTTAQGLVEQLITRFDVSVEHCTSAVEKTLDRLREMGAARIVDG